MLRNLQLLHDLPIQHNLYVLYSLNYSMSSSAQLQRLACCMTYVCRTLRKAATSTVLCLCLRNDLWSEGLQRILTASQVLGKSLTPEKVGRWYIPYIQTCWCPQNDMPDASCSEMILKARRNLFICWFYIYLHLKYTYFKYQASSGFFWFVCHLVFELPSVPLLLSSVLEADLLLQWETRPWAREVQNKWTKVNSDGLLEL